MRLEIHSDDTTSGRKQLDIGAEHLNRPEATVQQDEWGARTEDLIGELDAVDMRNRADIP